MSSTIILCRLGGRLGGLAGGTCTRGVPQNAPCQCSELQLFKQGVQFLGIGTLNGHVVKVRCVGDVRDDGGQVFGQQGLLPKILKVFLLLALELCCGVQQGLHGPIFSEQLGGCLGADSRYPRNVVRRVAHQPQQVDHLQWVFNAKPLTHFCRSPNLGRIALSTRPVHAHLLGYQLSIVLVGCHHVNVEALFLCQYRQIANHVVCLKARLGNGGNAHGLCHGVNVGNARPNVFGCFVPVGLVFGKRLVSERRSWGVKNDGQVGRFLVFKDVQHGGCETEHSAGIGALAVDAGVADKGIVCPENQGKGINQEELLFGFSG